jgi:hypothetical protein
MVATSLSRPLLGIAALAALVVVFVSLSSGRAGAQQPFPQSPVGGQRLQGKHVTIYLQNSAAATGSRTRESTGTDALVRINDTPVSIAGTVAGFSTEGGGKWIILTRQGAGEAWVPMDTVQLIEVSGERR